MSTKHFDIRELDDWTDFESEGTTSFNILDKKLFFHVLRKHNKVTFSINSLNEINPIGSNARLKKWVNFVSFTLSISKTGRLACYMSRSVSLEYLDLRRRFNIEATHVMHRHIALLDTLRQTNYVRGVVNCTDTAYESIVALLAFMNIKSESNISMKFFESEVRSLLRRNGMKVSTDQSLESLIAMTSYPLSSKYSNLKHFMAYCSYDGAEAVSASSFDKAIDRATFKREVELRALLKELEPENVSDSMLEARYFVELMNHLTVSKSYATDEERLNHVKNLRVEDFRRETLKPYPRHYWELMRELFREGRNEASLRNKCFEILSDKVNHRHSENKTLQYLFFAMKERSETVETAEIVQRFEEMYHADVLLDKDASRINYTYSERELGIDVEHAMVEGFSTNNLVAPLIGHIARLEGKKSSVPKRMTESYSRHMKNSKFVGYSKKGIVNFLDDERAYLSRRAKRLGLTLSEEQIDKLLTVSLIFVLKEIYKEGRRVGVFPDKVIYAVDERVSKDLLFDTIKTETSEYEEIRMTFDLPRPFRHAILKIESNTYNRF